MPEVARHPTTTSDSGNPGHHKTFRHPATILLLGDSSNDRRAIGGRKGERRPAERREPRRGLLAHLVYDARAITDIETAYHEAGHAVAYEVLGYKLYEVTVSSAIKGKLGHTRGESLIGAHLLPLADWSASAIGTDDWQRVCDDVVILLVGDVAEARLAGAAYSHDLRNPATEDHREIGGRIMRLCPVGDNAELEALAAELTKRARDLVASNWDRVGRVAEALLAHTTLTGEQVAAM